MDKTVILVALGLIGTGVGAYVLYSLEMQMRHSAQALRQFSELSERRALDQNGLKYG